VARVRASECLRVLRKHIQLYVADRAPDRVFIHAGVVVWNGSAIVCPGRSFAGKSTLVWSMVQKGAIYYSDEFAVLDNDGHIHAFPVPISLRAANGGRNTIVPQPAASGASGAVSPGFILFAEYAPGAKWEPQAVSPGKAALGLLRNTVAARRSPSRVLRVISRIVTATPAFAGRHSDAATVTAWMGTFGRDLFGVSHRSYKDTGDTYESTNKPVDH
jgi:hypothetical protein